MGYTYIPYKKVQPEIKNVKKIIDFFIEMKVTQKN